MTSMQDRQKTLTIEQLRQRYNLDDIGKTKKAIQLVKETLNKTETELNQFVSSTTKNLKELQDQVDGNITTWFFNGIPTTENEPAKNWTTEKDKANHIGDLYYDQDTGYAYRWAYEENSYMWSKIVDADVVKALAVANSAKDTADSKRRVFVVQPIPPYDIGDIWLKEDSELYRCRCARIKEDKFNISDWIIATKYTDDTVALETKGELNQFKTEVKENYTSNATFETTVNSIKGRVEETYTYTTTVENEVKDISKTKENIIDGNSLYLKEALESNALEYSIDGKCEQDGTPTPDSPVEIKTIKGIRNLLNLNAPTSTTNGITCTNNNDGSITINGHTTAGFTYYLTNDNITFEKGKKYTISAKVLSGSCTNYTSSTSWAFKFIADINNVNATETNIGSTTKEVEKTFDGSNASARPNLWFGWNSSTTENDAVFNDLRVQFMVEESDTKHSYVPYGTYEKIAVTGKNICNENNKIVGYGFDNANNKIVSSGSFNIYYIPVQSEKTYISSIVLGSATGNIAYAYSSEIPKLNTPITGRTTTDISILNGGSFTVPSGMRYLLIRIAPTTQSNYFSNWQLEEVQEGQKEPSDYEPYKEKEVLIDLAKENLFDKNLIPSTSLNGIEFTNDNGKIKLNGTATKGFSYNQILNNFKLKAGTYTHSINNNAHAGLYLSLNENAQTMISQNYGAERTFTLSSDTTFTKYIIWIDSGTVFNDYIISPELYVGGSPYYELNSIGDIKDKLEIVNGQVVIDKKIGKVVLNGSENWSLHSSGNFYSTNNILSNAKTPTTITEMPYISSTHFKTDTYKNVWQNITDNAITISNDGSNNPRISFDSCKTVADFKSWLQSNPVTVYYILKTPETITLPNTNIPLYEGVNHVTLVEDLETTTSIKYLRKTPISGEYALNQDLNKTNSNLADTNNQLSQTQSDIDNTKTNLNNNYYNKEQVDSINSTTTQNITQIRNTMEQNITSTNASISKIQEEITNGVSKVTTTTGTFDENGLNISKSGQQMSSTLDWDGLEVVRDKGKATETEVLTVRSAGVEAENMTVRNFLVKKPIRIEKCKSITDSTKVGLGFFWIGE